MINTIMNKYSGNQLYELEKWIDEGVLSGTIQTICDVRRYVESKLGEGIIDNKKILEGISIVGGVFTNRFESDTGDMCYVDLDKLITFLSNNKSNEEIKIFSDYFKNKNNDIIS